MVDEKTLPETSVAGAVVTPAAETPPVAPPQKPRKRGCGCLLPMLLLLVTVGLAPQIVMLTSLRNQLPAMLMAELPPGVVIGSASAGWISPMQLNDVMIPDDQGRPSLKLKHVTLSKSLWELAKSTDDLGTIVVEKPELKVYFDDGVSNYDQFIQRLSLKKGSGKRPLIDLQLKAGEITVREETRGQVAAVGKAPMPVVSKVGPATAPTTDPNEVLPDDAHTAPVALDLVAEQPAVAAPPPATVQPAIKPATAPPVEGKLLAIIDLQKATFKSQKAGEEELVGELTALLRQPAVAQPLTGSLSWNLPDGAEPGIGSGKLKLSVPSLPLAVLSPWLGSLTSGRVLSGVVSLEANAEVVPSEKELLLAAEIKLPHLDVQLSPVDAQSPPFRWTGDNLQLISEGHGDLHGQLVTFESVRLRTPIVNADFTGTVQDLPGQAICSLKGKCDLNPADLLARLPPEWASRIQVEGLQLGEIRVEGALRPGTTAALAPMPVVAGEPTPVNAPAVVAAPLRVSADVQWASANVLGFRSEKALINIDWSENQLSINPNRLPIGEGRWVASPRIEFTPAGKYLVFDGGPVFENVDLTQEMSDSWMRYVSPILGSATSIEGKFSVSASPARVALAPPYAGDFEGVFHIHSAQVGPSPQTRQIAAALGGLQTIMGRPAGPNSQWISVEDQQVPFTVAQGRVYHKDLQVGFGDVVIQSQGSVGFDQTIDFQLSVPIPDKWIAGRPLLAGLQGEVVPLPMYGTLDKPQLDGKALGEFGKRIGMKSAGGLIQQIIQRSLEKKANGGAPPTPRPPRPRLQPRPRIRPRL